MDWINLSLRLANNILELYSNEKKESLKKIMNKLQKEIYDEESKDIHNRDQSIIDRNLRELYFISRSIATDIEVRG